MTENPKLVAILYSKNYSSPTLIEMSKLEKFREICENFPTNWGHLIEVETGKILDTYNK